MLARCCCFLLMLLLIQAPAPLVAQELKVSAFGNLAGSMTPMDCRKSFVGGGGYAPLVAAAREAVKDGALVVSTGNLLGDDQFSRYLATAGLPGWQRLASMLRKARPSLICLGPGELMLPSGHSLPLLEHLMANDVPYGAANLVCRPGSTVCPKLRAGGLRLVDSGGVKVGLFCLVSKAALAEANPANVDFSGVEDPVAAGRRAVDDLRAQGAQVVIALANVDDGQTSPTGALDLARGIAGLDLVVSGTHQLQEDHGPRVEAITLSGSAPAVVEVAPGAAALTRFTLTRDAERPSQGPTLQDFTVLDCAQRPPAADVADALIQTRSEYCTSSLQPLPYAHLARPLSGAEFLGYVMEVARRSTSSDLCIFSSNTLGAAPEEILDGALSESDFNRIFPGKELEVLELRGADLGPFLDAWLKATNAPANPLRILGARRADDVLEINQRPLEPDTRYRIVTTRDLALGGGGHLSPILAHARRTGPRGPLFLRELMKTFLEKERPLLANSGPALDPSRDFTSLWELPRWDFRHILGLSFNQTYIQNDQGYQRSQLARSEVLGLLGELQSQARRSNRVLLWNNIMLLRYGETAINGEPARETQDLASLETAISWTQLRNAYGHAPWMPVPMLKGKLESEFTQADDRSYHHLEGTVTVGPQWIITDDFTISAGYGLRRELLYSADYTKQGFEFLYRLESLPIIRRGGTNLMELSSWFELFWSELGSAKPILEGIGTTSLGFMVFDWMKMNLNVNLYLFREGSGRPAFSADNSAGLALTTAFSVQRYW